MEDTTLPMRRTCRGLVVDGARRVLLAQHQVSEGRVWVGPGGGVEADETLLQALARELHEETGLVLADFAAPVLVWTQVQQFPEMAPRGYAGVHGHTFVVPLAAFAATGELQADATNHPYEDGVVDMRWWSIEEIEAAHRESALFSPRALPQLVRDILDPAALAALSRDPLVLGL